MHVATDDERDRLADRPTFPEHVQAGQILRIEAQLDAPTDQRRIDGVAIAGQRDRGGAGDAPQRPTSGRPRAAATARRPGVVPGW